MSSPFIVTMGGAEPCTKEMCRPFYLRDPATMLVGTFILVAVLYVMGCCYRDYFTGEPLSDNEVIFGAGNAPKVVMRGASNTFASVSSQAAGPERGNEQFAAAPAAPAAPAAITLDTIKAEVEGAVARGAGNYLRGPDVSRFRDFEEIDAIDTRPADEPASSHVLGTSDDTLADMIYSSEVDETA